MRFQNACHRGLIRLGLPVVGANLVIAAVWVLIVAALVRYGLWMGVVAAVSLVLMSFGWSDVTNSVAREPEWRDGLLGFGLYNAEGLRVDPHDPDRYNS
jgi:uncharacterized membrane protein YphA (DoxX/SURF4 family)